jgi:hypothetical protein
MLDSLFQKLAGRKHCVNKNKSFLAHISEKQNVVIDSPTWIMDQGKGTKYVRFPLPLLYAALSILNVSFFLFKKNNFLRRN